MYTRQKISIRQGWSKNDLINGWGTRALKPKKKILEKDKFMCFFSWGINRHFDGVGIP